MSDNVQVYMNDLFNKVHINDVKSYLAQHKISTSFLSDIQPFVLLINEKMVITVNKLLRIVPGRRLVFAGFIKNKEGLCDLVILKLFIDPKKYNKDYTAVNKGTSLLLDNTVVGLRNESQASECVIQSPPIIYASSDSDNRIAYFVYERIKNDFSGDQSQQHQMIIKAILSLHKDKVIQKDLHLNNFIINSTAVYCLDSEGLAKVTKNTALWDNFALFLAQLPIKYYKDWEKYIELYFKDNPTSHKVKSYILKKADYLVEHRLTEFNTKCLRDCTDFVKISSQDKFVGMARRTDYTSHNNFFTDLFNDPMIVINKHLIKILKDGNTSKVYLVNYHNKKYVIKRYMPAGKIHQFLKIVKHAIVGSRAKKSWLNSNLLEHIGVGTASAVAFFDSKSNLFARESYFIMEHLEDFERCLELFTRADPQDYILKIKELFNILNLLKLAHHDFKSVNIGFINNEVYLLDLDAMHRYKYECTYSRHKLKDYQRFLKCWQHDDKILTLLSV